MVEEGPLHITRLNALLGTPIPWGAPEGVRAGVQDLNALLSAYQGSPYPPTAPNASAVAARVQWPPRPSGEVVARDSGAHRLARGCIFCTENLTDTLDGWLLDRWHGNEPVYDAVFLHDVHAVLEVRWAETLAEELWCWWCWVRPCWLHVDRMSTI